MTIDVARLRELHQPMYGHTGDPCSWCREWTPCPVAELLDAYEERDRLRDENERAAQLAVEATHLILRLREERERLRAALQGIVTAIDNHHPKYKYGPFTLTRTEIDAARAALEGRE